MLINKRGEKSGCPVCGSKSLLRVLEIQGVPVHCNLLLQDREAALLAPRGDIRLRFCESCGHLFNSAFDPGLVDYSADYENPLHFSPLFLDYARGLARGLVDRHGLRGRNAIEIGCGDGSFLEMLVESGMAGGTGFDPGIAPVRTGTKPGGRIRLVSDSYSEKHSRIPADLLCCRHVLEHLSDPAEFLAMLRNSNRQREDLLYFFEVPNSEFILSGFSVWDLIYEHYSFFCGNSFREIFLRRGFRVLELSVDFNAQFLLLTAVSAPVGDPVPPGPGDKLAGMAARARALSGYYRDTIERGRELLSRARDEGRKVVVWSAGSKGVTCLNLLNVPGSVEYVVDINPRKHGKFIAGTGQRIVGPGFLASYRPDLVLVMNEIYTAEISASLEELGLGPELVPAGSFAS